MSCWSGSPQSFLNQQTTAIAFYCPLELDSKTLLLKITHTLDTGHRIQGELEASSLLTLIDNAAGFGREKSSMMWSSSGPNIQQY